MSKRVPRAESVGLKIANQTGGGSVADAIKAQPSLSDILGPKPRNARKTRVVEADDAANASNPKAFDVGEASSHLRGSRKAGNDALKIRFGDSPIRFVDEHRYLCPSQHSSKYYDVDLAQHSCTCPHWQGRAKPGVRIDCKHIVAVQLWVTQMQRPLPPKPPGTTVEFKGKPFMRRLASVEKACVQLLVGELVKKFPDAKPAGPGRPEASLSQLIGCGIYQTYANAPSTKALHDVDDRTPFASRESAWIPNFVKKRAYPSPTTLLRAMGSERMNLGLHRAIALTVEPVLDIDKHFHIDSTTMKSPLSEVVCQRKDGTVVAHVRSKNHKLHFAGGGETMMIFAAAVSDEYAHDSRFFLPLLDAFKTRVRVAKVCADAAYEVWEFFEAVAACGGKAYIDFKVDSVARGDGSHRDEQFALYKKDYDLYKSHYGERSLIESINSGFKRCGRRYLRSRLRECLEAEALLMVVKYNLCRLLIVRREHHVDIPWCSATALAQLDALLGHFPVDDLKSLHTEAASEMLGTEDDAFEADLPQTGT